MLPPAPTPTGNVQFYLDGVFNRAAPIVLQSGEFFTAVTPFFAADFTLGSHNGEARYIGDSHYPGTSAFFQFRVQRVGNAALDVVPNPGVVTENVTFTATIEHSGGQTPTGTVQFFFNGAAYGGPRTLDGNGRATFARNDLILGTYDVYYHYSGDSRYAAIDSEHVSLDITFTNDYDFGNPAFNGFIPYFGDINTQQLHISPHNVGEPGGHLEVVIYASHLVLRDGGNNIVYSGGVNCLISPGNGVPPYDMLIQIWSPLAGGWVSVDNDASYLALKFKHDDGTFVNPLRATPFNPPFWYNLGDDLCVGQLYH